jgi:hypothetical protein
MPEDSPESPQYRGTLVRTGVRACEDVIRLSRAGAGHAGLEIKDFVQAALANCTQATDLAPVPRALSEQNPRHFNLQVPADLWKAVQRAALDTDLDLQELVPRLLLHQGIRESEAHLARVKSALASEADPLIKVSLPAETLARARAAGALLGVEASEVLALALAERREGRLEEMDPAAHAQKGEFGRLQLSKALWRELQADSAETGLEPSQLAARVLEPYALGVLKRHLEAALKPKGGEIRPAGGRIDFARGYCPAKIK